MGFEGLLRKMMAEYGFSELLFDDIRLIDPVSKAVLSHINNKTKEQMSTEQKCYAFFNRTTTCENCTPMIAIQNKEQVTKIDYSYPNIYIMISEPILYEEKWYVIEILKNITNSGMIEIDGKEVVAMNRLLERRNSMMLKDSLTKIYREKNILIRLPHDLYRVQSEGRKLTLFLISIKNLKEINDLHGFHAGDVILKEFAAVLKSFSRKPDDWPARYMGSEFVIVIFNLDETQTNHVCKRIHERLSKIGLPGHKTTLKVVFTVGCHLLAGESMTTEELLSAARRNILHPVEEETSQEYAALLGKAFPNSLFSGREIEVASLLLNGKPNLEISQTLFVSLSTVKKHIASIFAKAQVNSRAEFIAKARKKAALLES